MEWLFYDNSHCSHFLQHQLLWATLLKITRIIDSVESIVNKMCGWRAENVLEKFCFPPKNVLECSWIWHSTFCMNLDRDDSVQFLLHTYIGGFIIIANIFYVTFYTPYHPSSVPSHMVLLRGSWMLVCSLGDSGPLYSSGDGDLHGSAVGKEYSELVKDTANL